MRSASGLHPWPQSAANEWSVVRLPSVVILNTVPLPPEPPPKVVPYRFPSLPWTSPATGLHPSLQSAAKEWSVVSVPPVVILKTVPLPPTPPSRVVPYRFPSLAWIRLAQGLHPSLQSPANEWSVVS